MVIIPASAAVAQGLTFTVGQITWTTHDGGLTTTTLEETQIQSGAAEVMVLITPTTITMTSRARPPLPRYKGKRVDNSDLLEAIDGADHKLLEASNLVDLISCKPDQAPALNFSDSHRPTRVTTHERLGMSLTITSTTEGRTVKLKTASPDENFPYGLRNAADQFSWHTHSLFGKMGLSPRQTGRTARHFVNMLSIHTLPEDRIDSRNCSTGSIPTEVLQPEDKDYDLDLPPYPLGFSRFPVFPPRQGDLVFNISNDEPVVDGETDEHRQQREQRNADRAR